MKTDLNNTDLQNNLNPKISVKTLVEQIKNQIKSNPELAEKIKAFEPKNISISGMGSRRAGELSHSENLLTLNREHAFSFSTKLSDSSPPSKNPIWRTIKKIKGKLVKFLTTRFFNDYFNAERDYHLTLCKFLNQSATYIDERDATIFWELVKKIDHDLSKLGERIDKVRDEGQAAFHNHQSSIHSMIEGSIGTLQKMVAKHDSTINMLESATSGLERILTWNNIPAAPQSQSNTPNTSDKKTDWSYLLLENRYRGSEAEISSRLTHYVELFRGANGPVLEIGPGRGELQKLFSAANISSYGVDTDEGMVIASKAAGLNVQLGNGIAHLNDLENGSLGGLIAVQVIEHLDYDTLRNLCITSRAKVAKGGKVIFETINSGSIVALFSSYLRDPTHVAPLHPETMKFIMEREGLKVLDIKYLSPFPKQEELQTLDELDFLTPRLAKLTGEMNNNIQRLNKLLFGYQDYCIIAEAEGR